MARPRLTLTPYAPGDVDRFKPRADFQAEKDAVAWAWPDGPPIGRTWTLRDVGAGIWPIVLGVGGVQDAGDGCWTAWALLSELTPRQWVVAGSLAAEALEGIERFYRPRQISATARASIPGAMAVLEKLGFASVRTIFDPRIGNAIVYQYMVRAA